MKKNTKVKVSEDSEFHAGRIGYLHFFGSGPSDGIAVLTSVPDDGTFANINLFTVDKNNIQEI